MRKLILADDTPFPSLVTELDDRDEMYDGRSDHYQGVGLSALRQIERALLGRPEPRRILDFPCGHGRVTRFLRARYPHAHITVSDLDRTGVEFAARTFGAQGVPSQHDFSKLDLGESFDLIWVGSLITHLSERQTRQVFDLAARHLSAQGTLVVTSHGSFVAKRMLSYTYGLTEDAARGLLADRQMHGYAFRAYPGGTSYGISLASRAWFHDVFADGPLFLVRYWERAWDDHQDVLALRRTPEAERKSTLLARMGIRLRTAQPVPESLAYAAGCADPPSAESQAERDANKVTGFDEAWYRATYADVSRDIDAGVWRSGLEHYMLCGWKEARPFCNASLTYDRWARRAPRDGLSGRVEQVWSESSESQAAAEGWYWMAHSLVRERLNRLASGDPGVDPYEHFARLLRRHGARVPIPRSLSIGCGFGGLERDLTKRGLIERITGFDIAAEAIAKAREMAEADKMTNIRFAVIDLERQDLPRGTFDVVFAHQAVHHIERLEQVFARITACLRPGGFFHLHEFVGPTRFQWTDAQMGLVNTFLDTLPPELRRLPSGSIKPPQQRPTIEDMIAADPSESVRSSDIPGVLAKHFDIVETRALGGALVHLALGGIAQNFDPSVPAHVQHLQRLFALEDKKMQDGTIGSDFVVITARKH